MADSFEMALMKAVRGAEIVPGHPEPAQARQGMTRRGICGTSPAMRPTSGCSLCTRLLKRGVTVDEDATRITKIDRWFLSKLMNLVELRAGAGQRPAHRRAVHSWPSSWAILDATIARAVRLRSEVRAEAPPIKMVDTCAGGVCRRDPLLLLPPMTTKSPTAGRSSWSSSANDQESTVIVLGSGPIRIGQGIEFDYCSASTASWALEAAGI